MNPYELKQLKQEMCDVGHRIWHRGFCAGNEGNHSAKIAGDRYLCTPTGISKGFMVPDDLIVCDGQGKQVEPNTRGRKPTSEIKVHLAIYRHRPDVTAVIHSHPPHATAFAIAGVPLPEGIHPEAEVFLGKVRTAPFAMPSTEELPQSILPLIDQYTNTVLMGNHGSVSFDKTLMGAYYKLEILDAYCRTLLLTRQLGHANTLTAQQMAGLLEVKAKFGMPDPRVACAKDGCVGQDNQPFFATFEDQPASAACSCNDTAVEQRQSQKDRLAGGLEQAQFDAMVKTITDQIVASLSK